MFNIGKTRMIGLRYGEKNYDDMLSRFHLVPERNRQTDGRTDRQTDRQTDRLLYQLLNVRGMILSFVYMSMEVVQMASGCTRAIDYKELCQLGQLHVPVADWSNPIM